MSDFNPELLESKDTAWEFYLELKKAPLQDRGAYYTRWMDLVSRAREGDQDLLLKAAKDDLGFQIGTMRKSLKERPHSQGPTRDVAGLMTAAVSFEVFSRPGGKVTLGFLVYDPATDTVREAESVDLDGVTYVPRGGEYLERETPSVRFPSGIEEYGTDAELWASIEEYIYRYVQLPEPDDKLFVKVAVAYVFMTWVYRRFGAVPYLRTVGDLSSGKTRLAQMIGEVCFRPISMGGATTPAPVFRLLDDFNGTLVLDEADFGASEMEDMFIKILTGGYKEGFPIYRAEKGPGAYYGKPYDAFGPKVIGMRRPFEDLALESRCLSHTMAVLEEMDVQPLQLPPNYHEEALQLRNKLVLWRFRHYHALTVEYHRRIKGMELRISELGLPLLACLPPGDPGMEAAILSALGEYSAVMKSERRASAEGLVIAALAHVNKERLKGKTHSSIQVRVIAQRLKQDLPNVTSRMVGKILRYTFKFKMSSLDGYPTVVVDENRLQVLAARYSAFSSEDVQVERAAQAAESQREAAAQRAEAEARVRIVGVNGPPPGRVRRQAVILDP